jgi:predicted RNA-binding Zn-ribbon protein involved in translation (DUF1610 family)
MSDVGAILSTMQCPECGNLLVPLDARHAVSALTPEHWLCESCGFRWYRDRSGLFVVDGVDVRLRHPHHDV